MIVPISIPRTLQKLCDIEKKESDKKEKLFPFMGFPSMSSFSLVRFSMSRIHCATDEYNLLILPLSLLVYEHEDTSHETYDTQYSVFLLCVDFIA